MFTNHQTSVNCTKYFFWHTHRTKQANKLTTLRHTNYWEKKINSKKNEFERGQLLWYSNLIKKLNNVSEGLT